MRAGKGTAGAGNGGCRLPWLFYLETEQTADNPPIFFQIPMKRSAVILPVKATRWLCLLGELCQYLPYGSLFPSFHFSAPQCCTP